MKAYHMTHGDEFALFKLTVLEPETAYDELEMHNIPNAEIRDPEFPMVKTKYFRYYTNDDGITAERISLSSYLPSYMLFVDFLPDTCEQKGLRCRYFDDLGKKNML